MSVISITEVRTGLQKNAVEIIDSLTDIFHPVSVDENIAAMAGALKQKYNLAINRANQQPFASIGYRNLCRANLRG